MLHLHFAIVKLLLCAKFVPLHISFMQWSATCVNNISINDIKTDTSSYTYDNILYVYVYIRHVLN